MSKPSPSGLEDRLGVRLLNRTTRSVTPAEAGARLPERLAPAIGEIADALAELDQLHDVPAGALLVDDDAPMVRAAVDAAGLAYAYHADVGDYAGAPSQYFLYYPSRRQMPPALRAFSDAVRAYWPKV